MGVVRDLIHQLKTGLRNLIMEIWLLFKKPYLFIRDLISPREKEIEIPEAWKNPNVEVITNPVPLTPVAVEPSIVFKEPVRGRFGIKMPPWFLKTKRMLAFVLLIGSCISMIGLIYTFPVGLLFAIPTTIIILDYLIKTRPKTSRMRWYILTDLEEEEESKNDLQ